MRSALPLLALACLACDREPAPAAAPSATPRTAPATSAAAPSVSRPSASASGSAEVVLPPISSTRPPAVTRWEDAAKVRSEGAPDGCDARLLDPWVRVRCQGGTSIRVTRGGGDGRTYAVTAPGEVALVTRLVEGVGVEAKVETATGAQALAVRWPRGEARPAVPVTFEAK